MSGLNVTILGCGASGGVPLIGCDCAVCGSANPKNKRSRSSILLETEMTRLLIDTSPDLRMQALNAGINTVDAIAYTHAHADHTHGLDDARAFNFHCDAPLPVYGDVRTLSDLRDRFSYAFQPPVKEYGWFRPALKENEIACFPFEPFEVGDMLVQPLEQRHGKQLTLGFRVGDMAYSTDVNFLPDESLEVLQGIKLWVVDCLQFKPAPTHAHLDLTLEWIEAVKPTQAVLTHMSHMFDFDALARQLPEGVEPAYDGMVLHAHI